MSLLEAALAALAGAGGGSDGAVYDTMKEGVYASLATSDQGTTSFTQRTKPTYYAKAYGGSDTTGPDVFDESVNL